MIDKFLLKAERNLITYLILIVIKNS